MNNLSDADRLELNELCNALVDGVAGGAERARLETMLAQSEDARRFYIHAMALSASLHDYAGEMQYDAPDAIPVNERQMKWWAIGGLAAAAAVLLAFWFGNMTPAERDNDETVARLSGAKDCQWNGAALQPGDELRSGQQIELAGGFAEITFDSGAQVTLEGPASLDLNSAWDAVLHRGTLKANVPEEAIGFRISNPEVDVVDLGTEFSMVVDDAGGTEVFVTKGSVETQTPDSTALVLRENQSRRFARGGVSNVRDHEKKFARLGKKVALDRIVRPPNFLHWSFNEGSGVFAASRASHDAQLEGADFSGARIEGRFANALRLDGGLFAKAPVAGFGKRTAAFWVRVPADAALPDAGALLAWPSVAIAWNRNPNHGAIGALRTEAGRGVIVGTTPLRDGRWHHLAVVLTPGRRGAGIQIKQYVDGRLEVVSAKRGGKRAELVAKDSAPDTLWIGRARDGSRFRGDIDELFLADRALAPQEIRQLMLRNKPAQHETLAAN